MKTATLLLLLLLVGADCRTSSEPYSFSGGDGLSRQQAVTVKAADVGVGVAAQMVWMKDRYPGWQEVTNRYERLDGKLYHEVEVTRDGQTNHIYFDYTACAPKD